MTDKPTEEEYYEYHKNRDLVMVDVPKIPARCKHKKVSPAPTAGRNCPCPCGSGEKYKKCCQ